MWVERIKLNYHPAKFCGHTHSGSRDVTALVCHLTLEEHVIKASNDLMVKSPSRYDTILPALVAIDTVIVKI